MRILENKDHKFVSIYLVCYLSGGTLLPQMVSCNPLETSVTGCNS